MGVCTRATARHRITRALAAVLAALGAALSAGPVATAGGPPAEPAAPDGFLVISRYVTGYVSLGVYGQPPGSTVRLEERVGRRRVLLRTVRTGREPTRIFRAVTWSCGRTLRRFSATAVAPDGTRRTALADIHTPSCADRLDVTVPRRVPPRGRLRVRIVDRWWLGDRRVELCVRAPRARTACRRVTLGRGRAGVVRELRAGPVGPVRVTVVLAGRRSARRVAVGAAPVGRDRPLPVLLTTGDSTVDGVDSVIADALGAEARVRSETHPGTRLSGGGLLAWAVRARGQVRRLRPRVTVVSLGANEGYDLLAPGPGRRRIACCGPAWVAGLAARQRRLMRTYARGRGSAVVWVLLPAPRSAARARIQDAVDRAALAAAAGLPGVHLADQRALFSPGGRYRETMRQGGRRVRVRAPDGIHLSATGQAVAAAAIVALVRRRGLLR